MIRGISLCRGMDCIIRAQMLILDTSKGENGWDGDKCEVDWRGCANCGHATSVNCISRELEDVALCIGRRDKT